MGHQQETDDDAAHRQDDGESAIETEEPDSDEEEGDGEPTFDEYA